MKRLLLLGVGSALMFTMGGVGSAQADTSGSAHKSTAVATGTTGNVTLGGSRCASCHRAHTAKAEYLLKQAQPGLCYTCHGGGGSFLDVVDGVDPGNSSGALRGGGFAYSLIDGAAGEMTITTAGKSSTAKAGTSAQPVTSRHQIDGVTTGTMWGNGAISASVGGVGSAATATTAAVAGDAGLYGVTLECGSCHDPHGNGNYRILRPVPSDAGTAQTIKTPAVPATATTLYQPTVYCTQADTATAPCKYTSAHSPGYVVGGLKGVYIPDVPAGVTRTYTTTDYWNVNDPTVPNVPGGTPDASKTDGYIQNVAAWCSTCHTRYLAASGAWNTPNAGYVAAATNGAGTNATTGTVDATFTYRHRSESAGTTAKPNCIQCHVSHGTSATMSAGDNADVRAPDGAIPTAGAGTAGAGSLNKGLDSGIKGGTAIGTSRLLRVNDRATCKMCHNV